MYKESGSDISDTSDFTSNECIDTDPLESLPEYISPLIDIFEERIKIENEFEKEIWEIRKKYDKRFEKLSHQIGDVANNIYEIEGVGYWLRALLNCQDIADYILEEDKPVLNYLCDIRSITITDKEKSELYPEFETPGIIIEFEFGNNPYFTNRILFKYFKLSFDTTLKDTICGKSTPYCFDTIGCNINWLDGKNVTIETTVKTQRHKKTKKLRTITKEIKKESFFDFFDTPDNINDQTPNGLLGQCPELDYLFVEWISNVVVRRSLHFFMGLIGGTDMLESFSETDESEDYIFYDKLGPSPLEKPHGDNEIEDLASHMKTFSIGGRKIGKSGRANIVKDRKNNNKK